MDKLHNNLQVKNDNDSDFFFDNILDIDISKPRTPYFIFSSDCNVEFMSIGERATAVKQKWDKLSANEKEIYFIKAEEEKSLYNRNMSLVKRNLINTDKLNDSRTPFQFFKESFIYEFMKDPSINYSTASEQAIYEWNSMTSYEQQEWKAQLQKEKSEIAQLIKTKPKSTSAYILFISDKITFEGLNRSEANSEWKRISDRIKKKYEERAKEINMRNKKILDYFELANGIKPKRPSSALSIFMATLSNEKSIDTRNFVEECTLRFNSLSEDEREYYEKQAKLFQIKYQIKKEQFYKFNNGKLNKGPSGFNLFVKENKHKFKPITNNKNEFFTQMHQHWLYEPSNIRDYYNLKAKQLKKEIEVQSIDDNKPIKPCSGYLKFIEINLKENKSLINLELKVKLNIISDLWTNLNINERNSFNDRIEKELEEYNSKMIDYEEEMSLPFNLRNKNTKSIFRDQIESRRKNSKNKETLK